nr:signal peptidase II [Methylohalobius crimeensis]
MIGRGKIRWLALTAVVVCLDQLTKLWVTAILRLHESIEILPFFRLTRVHNTGAAFSFLAGAGGWQRWFFLGLAVAASIVILIWMWRLKDDERIQAAGLALILGGALGNFIDRAWHGYVIDFLDVYYRHWHWPAFNLADAAITVGVALLLWHGWRRPMETRIGEEHNGS